MTNRTQNGAVAGDDTTDTAAQRQRLARWLREWEIHCRFADTEEDETAERDSATAAEQEPQAFTVVAGLGLEVDAKSLAPAAGQVRLLPPRVDAESRRPIFVAVIANANSEGEFLCAPFSRFGVPAVPGEFLTGRAEPAVRVLCVWNAGKLRGNMLAEGWFADVLDDQMMRHALALYRHLRDGGPLPAELVSRLGPPLVHPADPRHDYLDESADEMHSFSENWLDTQKEWGNTYACVDKAPAELLKAAEDRGVYLERGDVQTPTEPGPGVCEP